MFKGSKKQLFALLTLVMVLSMLPVAVCAEEEHIHDEACGCVSVLATCTHSSYVEMSDSEMSECVYYNTSQHTRRYYMNCMCNACGSTFKKYTTLTREFHNEKGGKTWSGNTEMIDGEQYYVYNVVCECGYTYTTYSVYPPS